MTTTDLAALDVLLVEDDPGDVLMVREVFEDHAVGGHLDVVSDGAEALAFLRREGEHADARRPDVVLLDLNLPKIGGREVLEVVKADDELRSIPVVVLTTSAAEEDILRAYAAHANAYVTKPVDWDAFTAAVRRIGHFFGDVARLPRPARG
ncbi:response regulator [Actinotalea solisilvae]|uniref:response regulator n=1 Tax=Actinotalea solisilvae TaxID=2072922 RepID=UPI0018F1BD84|nr:response regulator [Actinotalea solisilvae]